MGYEIPKEDEVVKIILKILKRRGSVESQRELHDEVMKHLLRINKNYKLSPKRMRTIALNSKKVRMEIRYKVMEKDIGDIEICPVCGSKMVKIENATLDGDRIIIGFKCVNCPYWTGKKLRLPVRYIFRYRG